MCPRAVKRVFRNHVNRIVPLSKRVLTLQDDSIGSNFYTFPRLFNEIKRVCPVNNMRH
jgi:hypothetical protein